jgi:hypothetical protein
MRTKASTRDVIDRVLFPTVYLPFLALAPALAGCGDDGTGSDADTDADSDADTDADSDADSDADTDADTDTNTASEACAALDGYCTGDPWTMCGIGFEPNGDDDPADCDFRCCVPASTSYSCNATADMNCIVGESCGGCWAEPFGPAHECEPGRVCCSWVCE